MTISNLIARMITEMLEDNEFTDIKRNELALTFGCVPSQINYVIASRFTPERGYIVESRRGGGGFIRIYKTPMTGDEIARVVGLAGNRLEDAACRAYIMNMLSKKAITKNEAKLLICTTSENCFRELPMQYRDTLRAAIFKQLLLTIKQIKSYETEE